MPTFISSTDHVQLKLWRGKVGGIQGSEMKMEKLGRYFLYSHKAFWRISLPMIFIFMLHVTTKFGIKIIVVAVMHSATIILTVYMWTVMNEVTIVTVTHLCCITTS